MTQLARVARMFWKAEQVVAAGGTPAQMAAAMRVESEATEAAWHIADHPVYLKRARRALNSLLDPRDLASDLATNFAANATFRLGWRAAMQTLMDEAQEQGVE